MATLPLPLRWEIHGEDGPTILLLHGFGTNGHTWNGWLPRLLPGHRVVVVEMKGFGDASKPRDEAYGPGNQADLLVRLILQEDLRDLTLVGHSLGGAVVLLSALRLMDHSPGRLTRLAILAGSAYPQRLSVFLRLVGTPFLGRLLLRVFPTRFVIRKALELAYHRPEEVTRSRIEAYAQPLRQAGGRYALSRSARHLIPPDAQEYTARYPELDFPALLIWGREDSIVPLSVGERLERALPRARLRVLEECGHMPQEERPEETVTCFLEFLARQEIP